MIIKQDSRKKNAPAQQNKAAQGKISGNGLNFTNASLVIKQAFSETVQDGHTINEVLEESQILQKQSSEDEDDEESENPMFRSQQAPLKNSEQSPDSKKFKVKKQTSLNMPSVLSHLVSEDFLKNMQQSQAGKAQVSQIQEFQQSTVSVHMNSCDSPTKPLEILNLQKIPEHHHEFENEQENVQNNKISKKPEGRGIEDQFIQTSFPKDLGKKLMNCQRIQFPIEIPLPDPLIEAQPLIQFMQVKQIVPAILQHLKKDEDEQNIDDLLADSILDGPKDIKEDQGTKNNSKVDKKILQISGFLKKGQEIENSQLEKSRIINDVMMSNLLEKISILQEEVDTLKKEKKQLENNRNLVPSEQESILQLKNNVKQESQNSVRKGGEKFNIRVLQHTRHPKIISNLYNLSLSVQESHDVKDQISFLKRKVYEIQNSQTLNLKQFRETSDRLINMNLPCDFSDQFELKGKFMKRFTHKNRQKDQQSHQNSESTKKYDEKHQQCSNCFPITKSETKVQTGRFKTDGKEKKKFDSSAVFKKKSELRYVSSNQSDQKKQQTIEKRRFEFQNKNQELIGLESEENAFIEDQQNIFIPKLLQLPNSEDNSERLIQLGLETFKKFNFSLTQDQMIQIKKYRNCVHFRVDKEHNILWHYLGKFYYGGWKLDINEEGQKDGQGLEYVPNKYRFKGSFQNGKRNGFGTLIIDNGTKYIGQWADGFKHGEGKQVQNQGQYTYLGTWYRGWRKGRGKVYHYNKIEYDGQFDKGVKEGQGREWLVNGDQYEGEYVNGKFQGKGSYRWNDGSIYVGNFFEGQRNGEGLWESNDGDVYQGQYAHDQKHGEGVYKWANGVVYQGSFKNDLKHGEGVLTDQHGKISHATWKNGEIVKKIQLRVARPKSVKRSAKLPISSPRERIRKYSYIPQTVERVEKRGGSNPKQTSLVQAYGPDSSKKRIRKKSTQTFTNLKVDELKQKNSSKHQNPLDPPFFGLGATSNMKFH